MGKKAAYDHAIANELLRRLREYRVPLHIGDKGRRGQEYVSHGLGRPFAEDSQSGWQRRGEVQRLDTAIH